MIPGSSDRAIVIVSSHATNECYVFFVMIEAIIYLYRMHLQNSYLPSPHTLTNNNATFAKKIVGLDLRFGKWLENLQKLVPRPI